MIRQCEIFSYIGMNLCIFFSMALLVNSLSLFRDLAKVFAMILLVDVSSCLGGSAAVLAIILVRGQNYRYQNQGVQTNREM